MRKFIILVFMLVMSITAKADGIINWFADEFKNAEYGLHLVSMHVPNGRTNNGNLGPYIITKSGWTYSTYHNSVWTQARVYGWTTPELWRVRVTMGFVSGYESLSGQEYTPLIAPSLRVYTFENVSKAVRRVHIKAIIAPNMDKADPSEHGINAVGLWHLMAGANF